MRNEFPVKHYEAVVVIRRNGRIEKVQAETYAITKNQAGLLLLRTIPNATGVRDIHEKEA